ncbi:conjugal transfer protein [Sphaerisporangium sp. TRM90804]|uniref:conjugal transfer protein n=1 Tax=Sphaerisporangium sp. TRM90804 TaxID=3031113 RepID=UPI002446EEDF|nr:conjugal transfer protein [Sphaerisporangium sp. TRM90804]MDH2428866.1 conjugal transfer protein [Sphaerisporangium sp. TRM90804]
MARRADVQAGPRTAGEDEHSTYPPSPYDPDPDPVRGRGHARRGGWSGGGGRWLVWAGRAILWAVILVIVVNGVRAPIERMTQGAEPSTVSTTPSGSGFPEGAAAAFANQFASAYLNFDGSKPDDRAERLKPFLPVGAETQFGWNGFGRMSAGTFQFDGIELIDAQNAVVTVFAQSGAQRLRLSVPIYYADGRFVVSGQPALLPGGAPADLPQPPAPERDDVTESELRPQLEGFFKAYAAGDATQLQRYVVQGVTLDGFQGKVTLAELNTVIAPPGGTTREVTAVVVWALAGPTPAPTATSADPAAQEGSLEQSYRLSMEKQGDNWYVKDIRGASRSTE